MKILQFIRLYFSERYSLSVRILHYMILFLVISQIAASNFMDVSADGAIGKTTIEFYAAWVHIITGLTLVLVTTVFITIELKKHGLLYFYPYLAGDFSQAKLDINRLQQFQLPAPKPKGLAAIVQGLGLCAILVVVFSGFSWFILWLFDSSLVANAQELHQLLTGLIEVYIIAHGSMGLIHLTITYRKQSLTSPI